MFIGTFSDPDNLNYDTESVRGYKLFHKMSDYLDTSQPERGVGKGDAIKAFYGTQFYTFDEDIVGRLERDKVAENWTASNETFGTLQHFGRRVSMVFFIDFFCSNKFKQSFSNPILW